MNSVVLNQARKAVQDEWFDGPGGWSFNKTKRYIKAPSGREYDYTGKGLPSQGDIDALVAHDMPSHAAGVGAVAGLNIQPMGPFQTSAGIGATAKGRKRSMGEQYADEANRITQETATAIQPVLAAPLKAIQKAVGADVDAHQRFGTQEPEPEVGAGLLAGFATLPINLAAEWVTVTDEDSSPERKLKAAANILLTFVGPGEVLAGGKILRKPLRDAFNAAVHGKNAVALEKVLAQAEKEGVSIPKIVRSSVPQVQAQAGPIGPVAARTGVEAGLVGSGRRTPKPPLKALPASTTEVTPGARPPAIPMGGARPLTASEVAAKEKGAYGTPTTAKPSEKAEVRLEHPSMTPEEIAASQKKLGIQPPEPKVETPVIPPKLAGLKGETPKPVATTPTAPKAQPKRVSTVETSKPPVPVSEPLGVQSGGQAVKNAATNALRNSAGLESLKSKPAETTQQWFDDAAKRGIPERAYQIGKQVLEGKQKRLDDVQSAGIATRLDQLDEQLKNTSVDDKDALEAIVDEIDVLTQATRKAGTEWGREGVARQTWFKSDYSPEGLTRRFVAEAPDAGKNAELAVKGKTIGNAIFTQEAKVNRMKAQAGLYTTRGAAIKGDIKAARADALARIKANWAGMSKTLPKNKQTGAINLDPKALAAIKDDLMIVVKSYVQEGAVTLGELLPKVRGYLRENQVDLSDDAIHRILAGEYEKSTRTVSAEAKILQDLRKEAKSTPAAQRATIERRIKAQEQRIRDLPGFTPKEKTPFHESLREAEIELMARKVEADNLAAELRKQRLAKQTHWASKIATEAVNMTRSSVASSDLSAPLNQGIFALGSHPLTSARAAKDMMKALKSEDALNRLIAEMRTNPHYNRAIASGLEVHSTRLGRGEEFFTSDLLNNLPIISHSERAYTAYLNKLRMDMFANLVKAQEKPMFGGLVKPKKLTIDQLKQTAEFVNTVTGVGTGGAAGALKKLNQHTGLMFAPGYWVSRIKTVSGTPAINALAKGNPRLAGLIVADYAKVIGVVGSGLYALKSQGYDVDLNPLSGKFGIVSKEGVEWDPTGGLLAPWRFAMKATQEQDGRKPNIPVAAGYYGTGKASPLLRYFIAALSKESFGKNTDPATLEGQKNLFMGLMPIQVQQQLEIPRDSRLTDVEKAAIRILTLLGGNVNVKEQPSKRS